MDMARREFYDMLILYLDKIEDEFFVMDDNVRLYRYRYFLFDEGIIQIGLAKISPIHQ